MRSSLNPACDCRASLVAELMRRPAAAEYATDPLRPLLASLIAGRACGAGVLPTRLGLEPPDFTALWDHYFPGPPLSLEAGRCQDLPELDDLIDLLLSYRAGKSQAEGWVARLVAHGCAGRDPSMAGPRTGRSQRAVALDGDRLSIAGGLEPQRYEVEKAHLPPLLPA